MSKENSQSSVRSTSGKARLLAGAAPAAGITFGLFLAMNAATAVEATAVEVEAITNLPPIVPKIDDTVPENLGYQGPTEISGIEPPPFEAPLSVEKTDITFKVDTKVGQRPEKPLEVEYVDIDLGTFKQNREIRAIRAPQPVYPSRMLDGGVQGECLVKFDVNLLGEAFNVRPDCTHKGFEAAAKRSVSKALFEAKLVDGNPVIQQDATYPIKFTITE